LRNIARYLKQTHQIEDIIRRTATGNIDIESVFRHVNEIHAFRTSLKLFIEEKFDQIKPKLNSLASDVKTIKGMFIRCKKHLITISKASNLKM
jgi:hypothetical protein